jgi:hypothetical protein
VGIFSLTCAKPIHKKRLFHKSFGPSAQQINERRDAKAQRIISNSAPLCLCVEIKFFAEGEKLAYVTASSPKYYLNRLNIDRIF